MQTKKKNGKRKHVSSDSSTDEDDVDQLEALLARRFHRGKGKFKGKWPIIVSIAMKLVTLQLDAHKRKITRMEVTTRTRKKITRTTKAKAKDVTLLKKTMRRMMMKWSMWL